jgi:hypothetical protein
MHRCSDPPQSSILAKEYQSLSEEEKNAFQPRIDDDKKRYRAEMEEWKKKSEGKDSDEETSDDSTETSSSDEDTSSEKPAAEPVPSTKKKAPKDPTKPHGKKNAYTFFLQENREEFGKANPDAKWPELVSRILSCG